MICLIVDREALHSILNNPNFIHLVMQGKWLFVFVITKNADVSVIHMEILFTSRHYQFKVGIDIIIDIRMIIEKNKS